MKKLNLHVAIAIISSSLAVFASSYDDVAVKACLMKSVRYLHADMTEFAQSSALEGCDYDTNRFLRLVKEVAQEDENSTWSMLLLVGKYGSSNDLSFVSGYLSSPRFGAAATEAYYCIDGVSSNSVAASARYLSDEVSATPRSKLIELRWLLKRFAGDSVPEDLKAYAYHTCLLLGMSATNEIPRIDRYINMYYPSYSNSVERLTILTNAVARGVNEYELRYLTNAIHHIELP